MNSNYWVWNAHNNSDPIRPIYVTSMLKIYGYSKILSELYWLNFGIRLILFFVFIQVRNFIAIRQITFEEFVLKSFWSEPSDVGLFVVRLLLIFSPRKTHEIFSKTFFFVPSCSQFSLNINRNIGFETLFPQFDARFFVARWCKLNGVENFQLLSFF